MTSKSFKEEHPLGTFISLAEQKFLVLYKRVTVAVSVAVESAYVLLSVVVLAKICRKFGYPKFSQDFEFVGLSSMVLYCFRVIDIS
jgi:hypothetical protein